MLFICLSLNNKKIDGCKPNNYQLRIFCKLIRDVLYNIIAKDKRLRSCHLYKVAMLQAKLKCREPAPFLLQCFKWGIHPSPTQGEDFKIFSSFEKKNPLDWPVLFSLSTPHQASWVSHLAASSRPISFLRSFMSSEAIFWKSSLAVFEISSALVQSFLWKFSALSRTTIFRFAHQPNRPQIVLTITSCLIHYSSCLYRNWRHHLLTNHLWNLSLFPFTIAWHFATPFWRTLNYQLPWYVVWKTCYLVFLVEPVKKNRPVEVIYLDMVCRTINTSVPPQLNLVLTRYVLCGPLNSFFAPLWTLVNQTSFLQ